MPVILIATDAFLAYSILIGSIAIIYSAGAKFLSVFLANFYPPHESDPMRRDIKARLILWDAPTTILSLAMLGSTFFSAVQNAAEHESSVDLKIVIASCTLITLPTRVLILLVNLGFGCISDFIYTLTKIILYIIAVLILAAVFLLLGLIAYVTGDYSDCGIIFGIICGVIIVLSALRQALDRWLYAHLMRAQQKKVCCQGEKEDIVDVGDDIASNV